MSDSNSRLVYSTETGRIDEPKAAPVRPKGDGVVRIQRQTSGRKGKGVCLITGVDLDDAELTKLAAELKKKCGCGGRECCCSFSRHFLTNNIRHTCIKVFLYFFF